MYAVMHASYTHIFIFVSARKHTQHTHTHSHTHSLSLSLTLSLSHTQTHTHTHRYVTWQLVSRYEIVGHDYAGVAHKMASWSQHEWKAVRDDGSNTGLLL